LDVSAEEGFARVTATGRLGFEDIQAHLVEANRVGLGRIPELIDATRVEAVGASMRELLAIAHVASESLRDEQMAPRAIVVGSPQHFACARIFASLVCGWMTVGVFTDRREALLWLEHRTGQRLPATRRRLATG
jgi:hypothetical protein